MSVTSSASIGSEVRVYENDPLDPKGKWDCYIRGRVTAIGQGMVEVSFENRTARYKDCDLRPVTLYFEQFVLLADHHGEDA